MDVNGWRRHAVAAAVVGEAILGACAPSGIRSPGSAIKITGPTVVRDRDMTIVVHADEAAYALQVIDAATENAAQKPWTSLRATEAFRRLHERESAMGRDFRDAKFFAFLR